MFDRRESVPLRQRSFPLRKRLVWPGPTLGKIELGEADEHSNVIFLF
jgi:hypothetical protein